jgi:protein subunit release factor A
MITLEIHASAGGADAEIFAGELAEAISSYTGVQIVSSGKVFTLHRL